MAENHARKFNMKETGDTALKVRGRLHVDGNVLQSGGLGDTTVWVGDVGPLAAMKSKVEGTHTGFLRKITGKQYRRL